MYVRLINASSTIYVFVKHHIEVPLKHYDSCAIVKVDGREKTRMTRLRRQLRRSTFSF